MDPDLPNRARHHIWPRQHRYIPPDDALDEEGANACVISTGART